MARFYINIANWRGYQADASLEKPNDDRQNSGWELTQVGADTISVAASTSAYTPSMYCLDLQASTTATTTAYYSHSSGTAPFFLNALNSKGYTIDFQAKVISSGASGGQVVYFRDDVASSYINLGAANVKIGASGTTYAFDATADFVKYRACILGTTIELYVNDTLRISTTMAGTSGGNGTSGLFFGDYFNTANIGGRVQWGYVRYSTDGAFPSVPKVNDGWVFSNFDIQDKRNISENSVIRSENNIISFGKKNPAKLKLSGTIAGSCWDSFRNCTRRLKRMFGSGILKIYMDDFRYIEGHNSNFSLNPVTQNYASFTSDFSCQYPYWQNSWASYFKTAPVSNATFYITNSGDVEVPLKLIVTGAASGTISNNIQIQNITKSQIGKYVGSLGQTAELFIDKGYDIYNDYNISIAGTDSFGSYEGDLFTLNPGINKFVFTGGSVGTMEFYWREAGEQ